MVITLVCVVFLILVIVLAFTLYENYKLRRQIQTFDEARKWYRMAFRDDLTGLNNRTAYNQKIEELQKGKRRGSTGIILFDVDNFKMINDTKGHPEGDRVLRYVGSVLSEIFSSTLYSVYRIGGDEFAVIGERVMEEDVIEVLLTVRERFMKDGDIRLSKGYSMVGKDVTKAINDADKMLYVDKGAKK
ncbi:MAG: diguanylate cyclase [Ruminococcaceae bacterium]|nr:diguanylate cyclase [Oscillospiraceae bacterium]